MTDSERAQMLKYAHWVNEIDKDPAFLDHISGQLTDWEVNRLSDHIGNQIGVEKRRVNETLLLNPELVYGKDFTILELEKLKKVNAILNEWRYQRHKENFPKPEPLSIAKALYSLKSINFIFLDQLKQSYAFFPITVSAPIALTDFPSLNADILDKGTTAPEIKAMLNMLKKAAEDNLAVYKKIEQKNLSTNDSRYYSVDSQFNIYLVNTDRGISEIDNNPHKQVFYLAGWLMDFCKTVYDFLNMILTESSNKDIEKQPFSTKQSYKRHPALIELLIYPQEIRNRYHVFEFQEIDIVGFGNIPVPEFAMLAVKHQGYKVPTVCLQSYAQGFLDGYNTSLIPFIDTPAGRREVIFQEAIKKGGKGFVEHEGDARGRYHPEDFYETGVFEGKRYKAWHIVFETPGEFIDYLKKPDPAKSVEKRLPEKWYALYHMILVALGKQSIKTLDGTKETIIKFGKNQYGTDQGFYNTIRTIDLNNMVAFVRSLPKKDKNKWKEIIREISNNDADVISWLSKQPNI